MREQNHLAKDLWRAEDTGVDTGKVYSHEYPQGQDDAVEASMKGAARFVLLGREKVTGSHTEETILA